MAVTRIQTNASSFSERVLSTVDEYRNAPDRDARDRRYLEDLRIELRDYEERFGVKSSEIHDRIDDGTLLETVDVCHWIIAVNKLERAKAKQS